MFQKVRLAGVITLQSHLVGGLGTMLNILATDSNVLYLSSQTSLDLTSARQLQHFSTTSKNVVSVFHALVFLLSHEDSR